MKNYPLIQSLVVLFIVLTAGWTADAAPEKPNIIFIMADDAGYGDFGCFGSEAIHTPNIDQLAREGMKFTHAYAGATVCAPARSTLMTGQHTGHTTVRDNAGGKQGVKGLGGASGRVPLNDDDVTIAEVLKTAGYTTGAFGKWGLGEPETTGHPLNQGFDEWFGYLNQRRAHTYYTSHLWSNRSKVELEDGTYSHYPIEKRSLKFMEDHQDKPFFLYLGYTLPHSNYTIPHDDPAYDPYRDKDWSKRERNYAGMVTRFDHSVGTVISRLETLGLRDNTIVFVTSDNGPNTPFLDKPLNSNGTFRGHKRKLYEGGIRIPMVVSWPGHVPQNKTSTLPWYFPDVLPTAAEFAGVSDQVPENVDGTSIVPALLGQNQGELRNRPMYWEYQRGGFQQAARLGHWKAVRNDVDEDIELYHLKQNPEESNDVSDKHAERVARFQQLFIDQHEPSPSWPSPLD